MPLRASHLFAVALALPFLLGGAPARESIAIAVEDAADPWSRADGSGYANDVVRAAFAASGVDVQFRIVPYARCKRLVLEAREVACLSMSPSPELTHNVVLATPPLFVCDADVFERTAHPLGARSIGTLPRGAVVGIVLGYEYPDTVLTLAASGAIVLEPAGSELVNLRKLAAGRLDAAIVNNNEIRNAAYVTAQARVTGLVRPAFSVGTLRSYVGFSRAHARGAWARDAFERGYRTIERNGRLTAIRTAWLHEVTRTTERSR